MWQAVIHHISCMTAEGLEKRCDGGLIRGGNLMLSCILSMLRLFRMTYQRIFSKYSLCRGVLEVVISQHSSTVNIRRKLKIPVLRRMTPANMRTLAHVILDQTNKNTEGQFIYFLLFHSPGTPQVLMWEYCGIANGKNWGWGCFPPKTPTQETAWQFTPEKFPPQVLGCLITWCWFLLSLPA